jgi:hypothetical protein
MNLSQVPINVPDTVRITTSNTNYTFIQNTLRPSYYVRTAIMTLLGLAGVIAFLYLLWGGIQWITAGGDKDALEKARRKLINALIGLAIVFSAYAILFILRTLFNINLIGWNLNTLGS